MSEEEVAAVTVIDLSLPDDSEDAGADTLKAVSYTHLDVYKRQVKRQYQGIITLALALAAIVCIFVMQQHLSYAAILISGMVLFFVLGFFGSAVHSIAARIVRASAALARIVGIAYALGIRCV